MDTGKHAGSRGDDVATEEGWTLSHKPPNIHVTGVDPGRKGAIVNVWAGELITINRAIDIPLIEVHSKHVVDAFEVWNFFHHVSSNVIAIEQPFAMTKSGAARVLQQGRNWGILWGAAKSNREHVWDITPNAWKKFFGLQKVEKQEAINVAVDLVHPDSHVELQGRTKEHTIARCEAALIALYCASKWRGTPGE